MAVVADNRAVVRVSYEAAGAIFCVSQPNGSLTQGPCLRELLWRPVLLCRSPHVRVSETTVRIIRQPPVIRSFPSELAGTGIVTLRRPVLMIVVQ